MKHVGKNEISSSSSFLYNFKLKKKLLVWETLAIFAQKRIDMKKKFDNTDNILGGIVKKVRQEKGLSQEALGEYVGLGKSSISKIESGKTNISIDDASVLLEVRVRN